MLPSIYNCHPDVGGMKKKFNTTVFGQNLYTRKKKGESHTSVWNFGKNRTFGSKNLLGVTLSTSDPAKLWSSCQSIVHVKCCTLSNDFHCLKFSNSSAEKFWLKLDITTMYFDKMHVYKLVKIRAFILDRFQTHNPQDEESCTVLLDHGVSF